MNLESVLRSQIEKNLSTVNKSTFDEAQKRIQTLLENDSYIRFLQSDLYIDLARSEAERQMHERSYQPHDTPTQGGGNNNSTSGLHNSEASSSGLISNPTSPTPVSVLPSMISMMTNPFAYADDSDTGSGGHDSSKGPGTPTLSNNISNNNKNSVVSAAITAANMTATSVTSGGQVNRANTPRSSRIAAIRSDSRNSNS